MNGADILLAASAIAAETCERPAAELYGFHATLMAVSPGHALAVADRIGKAIYAEPIHQPAHCWFRVGDVFVCYHTPAIDKEVRP